MGFMQKVFDPGSVWSDSDPETSTTGSVVDIAGMLGGEKGMLHFMSEVTLVEQMRLAGYDMTRDKAGQWILKDMGAEPATIEGRRAETMQRQYQENMMQFMKGDFALSEEQRQASESQFAPLRQAIEDAFGPEGAAQESLEYDIREFSREISRKTKEMAAESGRSPMDPEFQMQIQERVSQEVGRRKLDLESKKAEALIGVEQQATNLRLSRFDPSKIGQGVQLTQAIKQQRIQNLMGASQQANVRRASEQEERFRSAGTRGTSTVPGATSEENFMAVAQVAASMYGAGGGGGGM